MEGALGHPGEHRHHRVSPVLLVHVGEADDLRAVVQEGAAEEFVSHEYVYHLKRPKRLLKVREKSLIEL